MSHLITEAAVTKLFAGGRVLGILSLITPLSIYYRVRDCA